MVQKAQASMEVQVYLVSELRENTANTEDEIQKFKRAAEEYMIKQIVKVKTQDQTIFIIYELYLIYGSTIKIIEVNFVLYENAVPVCGSPDLIFPTSIYIISSTFFVLHCFLN
jgi:hypothetical protein